MAGRAGLGPIVDVVRPVDTAEVADPALVLWYDRPATLWMNQALPIGNGEIGGMVFGGTAMITSSSTRRRCGKGAPSRSAPTRPSATSG